MFCKYVSYTHKLPNCIRKNTNIWKTYRIMSSMYMPPNFLSLPEDFADYYINKFLPILLRMVESLTF